MARPCGRVCYASCARPLALSEILVERHANSGVRAVGIWFSSQALGQGDFVMAGVKKLETFILYAKGQDPDARAGVVTPGLLPVSAGRGSDSEKRPR